MIYDIYLLRLGFHPVAVVVKLVRKQEKRQLYILKEKQYTKQNESTKYTKWKTNIQNKKTNINRILKCVSRVIRK